MQRALGFPHGAVGKALAFLNSQSQLAPMHAPELVKLVQFVDNDMATVQSAKATTNLLLLVTWMHTPCHTA